MKKYFGLIIALLFVAICLPVTVEAKNKDVTVSETKVEATKATVSGKTEALAVMVQVRDANNNILGLETFATTGGAFTGEVTGLSLAADTDYKVFVADYEGGNWATQTVKYASSSSTPSGSGSPAPAANNIDAMIPKTGIQLSLFIASALAALAVMGVVVIRRRSIK
jgi:LPXTG-motif cell wall-anchored protein